MFLICQQNHHIVRMYLAELGTSLPVPIFDQPMLDNMGDHRDAVCSVKLTMELRGSLKGLDFNLVSLTPTKLMDSNNL